MLFTFSVTFKKLNKQVYIIYLIILQATKCYFLKIFSVRFTQASIHHRKLNAIY